MKNWLWIAIGATVLSSGLPGGCSAQPDETVSSQPNPANSRNVDFVPFKDSWAIATERYRDITDQPFNAFIKAMGTSKAYSYANARVTLTYDAAPATPYFLGHITASGLKPNFAYQLKLAGKPSRGTRGWGKYGDDRSNERIAAQGRWWCESSHAKKTNFDDSHYEDGYRNAEPGTEHNIYGYIFMGSFVTDQSGNASLYFTGQNSYHVNWKQSQLSSKQQKKPAFVPNPGSPFSIGSTTGYGYGGQVTTINGRLWYEYEDERARDNVQLPAGKYNGRFLLTEESFHSTLRYGGRWKTILATEDFIKDTNGNYLKAASGALIPDTNPDNDVLFSIGPPGDSASSAPADLN